MRWFAIYSAGLLLAVGHLPIGIHSATRRALASEPAPAVQAPAAPDAAAPSAETTKPAKLANTLRWSTASEVDNYGFDIYRADRKEGPFTRINKKPVAGAGTSDLRHEYVYHDETIEAGREYFYFVESISLEGRREAFTPVFRAGPKPAPELTKPGPPAPSAAPAAEPSAPAEPPPGSPA